jgi:hypothetical protein
MLDRYKPDENPLMGFLNVCKTPQTYILNYYNLKWLTRKTIAMDLNIFCIFFPAL